MKREMVIVTWRDCVSLGGWQYLADMKEWAGRTITTVGMVVEESEIDLVLAMSCGDASAGEVLCNWMSIPKSSILTRLNLIANVEVTGAARLYRAASGGPQGWASQSQWWSVKPPGCSARTGAVLGIWTGPRQSDRRCCD